MNMEVKSMEEATLLNKLITIAASRPDNRTFYFNGLLTKITEDDVYIRDIMGKTEILSKKDVKIWEMKNYQIEELVRKYPRDMIKTKFAQMDQKILDLIHKKVE